MQLNLLVRFPGFTYLTLLICILAPARSGRAQGTIDGVPKIGELKAISYQKTTSPTLADALPSCQDLITTIRLARAYAQGKQVLPNYHEPVLTRGASGIAVFRSISPSVVLIVIGDVKNQQFEPSGLGAGVILDSSGDILTNWHVVNGYRGALIFLKPQGSAELREDNAYGARVIAQDELIDLALLRIVKPPSNLRSVVVGSISSVQVAEDIHVIGHPKGNLWSYTTGVVSQVRDRYDWTYSDGSHHEAKVLQLQTAINPGNSGGPVVDDQGRLLGLVAMGEEGQNLNYAIAADVIQSFLSRAASLNTRGGGLEPESASVEYAAAHLQDGRRVLRASCPELIEYLVSDEKGNLLALRADAKDGTELAAWRPNSFGGFGEWRISFPGGVEVVARGSGAVPDLFSAK